MSKAHGIDDLIRDLTPVQRMRPQAGMAVLLTACLMAAALTVLLFGARADLSALAPSGILILRSGLLLLVGLAAGWAVIASASPAIGRRQEGWRWALAAAALAPATSLMLSLQGGFPMGVLTAGSAALCLAVSLVAALSIGAALVVWLRQGAVTELPRAGWLVGLTAGALGTFAYSLHCPSETIHYAAVWYTLTVATSALLGRLITPRLLRW